MMPANVKLSKNELALVCDEQFILTKNNIIDKVYQLFGLLSIEFTKELEHTAIKETEIFYKAPKIYKGEQYKSLPYVMLDHPRCFNKEDAFAIRCFFWWGNFFSITLHLSGKFKNHYASKIINSFHNSKVNTEWYFCISKTQWQHDFGSENYERFSKISHQTSPESITQKSFLKIAKKISLTEWDDVHDFYISNFTELLKMLE
jgi:hypothetical protein